MAAKMNPEIYLQSVAEFLDKLTDNYHQFSQKKYERHEYIATIIIQEVEGVLPELGINIQVNENEGDVFAYIDSLYNTINQTIDDFDELEDNDNINAKRIELFLLASELHKAIVAAKKGYNQFIRKPNVSNNVEMGRSNSPVNSSNNNGNQPNQGNQGNQANQGNDDMGGLLNMLASAKI